MTKTKLQEYFKKFKTLPRYKLIKTKGPNHKPIFYVQVKIKSFKETQGTGSSKKLAEQDAATSLIKKLS